MTTGSCAAGITGRRERALVELRTEMLAYDAHCDRVRARFPGFSPEECEEVVDATIAECFRGIVEKDWGPERVVQAFKASALSCRATDHYRRHVRRLTLEERCRQHVKVTWGDAGNFVDGPDYSPNAEERLMRHETEQVLRLFFRQFAQSLRPRLQKILAIYEEALLDDRVPTTQEIGERLGIHRSRVSHNLADLRRCIVDACIDECQGERCRAHGLRCRVRFRGQCMQRQELLEALREPTPEELRALLRYLVGFIADRYVR